jgi:hypothetical protein
MVFLEHEVAVTSTTHKFFQYNMACPQVADGEESLQIWWVE